MLLGRKDRAEVEDEAVVLDARDDGCSLLRQPEARFQFGDRVARTRDRDQVRRKLLVGRRAATDDGEAIAKFDARGIVETSAKVRHELFGAGADLNGRHADHADRRDFVEGAAEIGTKRDFERRDGQLIDAERAEERVPANAFDEISLACDDASLRAAEELIAAKRNDIRACGKTFARNGLGDAVGSEIGEAAGAEVLVNGDFGALAERSEFFERGALGEAGNAEIRGVDAKKEARAFVDGALVVADPRAIRRAYFVKDGATFGHDLGDAEAVADFDKLTARDDDFGGFRERVEDEKDGGGVVVDDDGGFGADEIGEEAGGVDIALSALAGGDVVFEIGVARGGRSECIGDCGPERRAAEIGVKDDARGVDDGREGRGEAGGDFSGDARFERREIRGCGDGTGASGRTRSF